MRKPRLALTQGDPAGVGPETIAGAWSDPTIHDSCEPLVIGHPEILRAAVRLRATPAEVVEISAPEEARPSHGVIPCLAVGSADVLDVRPGTIDPRAGHAAYQAIVLAAELALAGRYRYQVINDNMDQAVQDICRILTCLWEKS